MKVGVLEVAGLPVQVPPGLALDVGGGKGKAGRGAGFHSPRLGTADGGLLGQTRRKLWWAQPPYPLDTPFLVSQTFISLSQSRI